MKDKIFSFLKERIGKTGADGKVGKTDINDRTILELANIIAARVSEESQIEEAATPFISFLNNEVQGNINSVVAATAKANPPGQNPEGERIKEAVVQESPNNELAEKLNAVLSYVEEQKQASKRKETEKAVREILKKGGATNEAVLDISLGLTGIDTELSAQELADKCKGVYDEQFKRLYGDSGLTPGFNAGNSDSSDDQSIEKLHQKILKERNLSGKTE